MLDKKFENDFMISLVKILKIPNPWLITIVFTKCGTKAEFIYFPFFLSVFVAVVRCCNQRVIFYLGGRFGWLTFHAFDFFKQRRQKLKM